MSAFYNGALRTMKAHNTADAGDVRVRIGGLFR